jgi:hypothetical protein
METGDGEMIAQIAKALTAAIISLPTGIGVAYQSGDTVTGQEWIYILLSCFAVGYATWQVPNRPSNQPEGK